MRLFPLILIALLLGPGPLNAEEQKGDKPTVEARSEEFIETDLPTTQHEYELDLSIRPKAGDIIKEDYIRMPIRVKYGITNNLEFSALPLTYFDNFFKGQYGLYMTDIALGGKYNYGETYPESGIDMALSFKYVIPVRYDTRISDGYYHYLPAVLFSTRFRDAYNIGAGIGVNIVQGEGPAGSARPNDTLSTGASLSYKPGESTYTLETVYITDEPYSGETEHLFITPGFSLDIKDWLNQVPGIWTLSSGIRIGLLDAPEDFEFLIRLKVHIRFDYKFDVMRMRLIRRS
jgi:hypothetical protein